jgi:pimeloyl-ACP methyl ester carboxylesterase
MARAFVPRFWVGTLTLSAGLFTLAALAPVTPAQAPAKDAKGAPTDDPTKIRVPIPTADGLELDGFFYTPSKGTNSPCVMLVHRYGSDRTKGEWNALAKLLQARGFAVLSFDLRGHGASTTVAQPSVFWNNAWNRNGIKKASDRRTSIVYTDFQRSYFPMLVNDLVAARRFLDTKHDARECNAGSLFVIGAQEGASLGLLWVATEFERQVPVGLGLLGAPAGYRPAGDDLAGACWLGAMTRPQNITFNVTNWLQNYPKMRERVPMCFFYGEENGPEAATAKNLYDHIIRKEGGRDKHKLDEKNPLPNTKLGGQELLSQADLRMPERIERFLDKVLIERKAIPWTEFNVRQQAFQLVPLTKFGFNAP